MKLHFALFYIALLSFSLQVQADTLYKCQNGGTVLYTNQKGNAKNCIILSRELPITTLAAPKPRQSTARTATAAAKSTPGDFPRVNAALQRSRDNDRRSILEQELANEQQQLEQTRQALNASETGQRADAARQQDLRSQLDLHERNSAAIRRELANLK